MNFAEEISSRFIANRNAYFYEKLRDISDTAISNFFVEVSAEKDGHYLVRTINKAITISEKESKVSMCIFRIRRDPSFLSESIDDVKELTYAYVLIVQYSNRIALIKKMYRA